MYNRKHGWLIYQEKDAADNASYITWMIEEAERAELSLELVLREEMTIGIRGGERETSVPGKEPADFAIVRTVDPFLSQHLEASGIPVFNSSVLARIANDKALTHHYMLNLGIPMVATFFYPKAIKPDIPPLFFPFVWKGTTGRGGKQVKWIGGANDWQEFRDAPIHEDYLLQACDVQLGKDVRVFVIGSEIIAAVLRENMSDFRANYKLGGTARLYELKPHERQMVDTIIQHFPADMAGIDFLIGYDGELLFNELEDVVGSRTLSAVSDINIVRRYICHIKRKLES
ncbi:ATP-grasp domain-containing protein [Lentibacillus sediminis]|uniref:ATP-grasp domain-containing protein n=1 Tax=Lentibacillus sediminis TaxID=1940529 RepID=UPI000C1BDF18|nr:hypothetical protein [Lentibacillus sediminis]